MWRGSLSLSRSAPLTLEAVDPLAQKVDSRKRLFHRLQVSPMEARQMESQAGFPEPWEPSAVAGFEDAAGYGTVAERDVERDVLLAAQLAEEPAGRGNIVREAGLGVGHLQLEPL